MSPTIRWRRRAQVAMLALCALTVWAAAGSSPSKSALETDPDGWTDLLEHAGPNLDGWRHKPIPPNGPLNPKASQWKLHSEDGSLLCEGDGGHEWLQWDREIDDFILHVECRFVASRGVAGFNSGIFVRSSADGSIWHQVQLGDASGGFLFGETLVDGKRTRFNLARKQLSGNRIKPAGQWNTIEVTCKGGEVTVWVNGAVTNVWRDCQVRQGHIGLEAEGFPILFRNVKLKGL